MHFDKTNHIYFDNNSNKVDSFSQIIKALNLVYYPPGMKAANRGTEMHSAIEEYEKKVWIPELSETHEIDAIESYKKFKKTFVKEVIGVEIPFIAGSEKDNTKESLWAGCADYLFINNLDQLCLADFKSGNKYVYHKIQLAAYSYGLLGKAVPGYIVYLDKDIIEEISIAEYRDYWMAVFMTYYCKKKRRLYDYGRVLQRDVEYPNQRARNIINEHKDEKALW